VLPEVDTSAVLAPPALLRHQHIVTSPQPAETLADRAPSATRHDLQLGRRLFHLGNGVATATAYALLFSHQQIVRIFGTIACVVYIVDRIRLAYPDVLAGRAPWINRLFLRAEEQVREAAMTPFAIAVLLTILTVPKLAALIAIYTLGIADPLAAVVGIRFGRHRITHNRTVEGSLAFFATTMFVAVAVLHWGTTAAPPAIAGVAACVGLVALACELLPLRVDDNLTIPIVVGFAAWCFCLLLGVPVR
jgi:dolichol kinase